ncbi:polysaccharide biosynthesis protein [Bifidobacterium gallicum]|uniref:Capsular polysaccharide synthesis protein n=1 Tax=Bifidobacterium gallicum DSM 20093 = LMG 11596 TaxID=561180 RepID=D1NRS9_9BIFI|nr:polysaccharide biosynthesis protein [Bifidobacterium gallicum]EFA23918.1 capsular polysaccharide synthesis protein [Bifidobacterium gallicum DSM 20093 = LMG 11596]KFI59105.1 putative polysaccharide biosynthesis protein [Bifidobacterium gallicum DSM 20093 = LMG 11596]
MNDAKVKIVDYLHKVSNVLRRNWKEFQSARKHIGFSIAMYGLVFHLFGVMGKRYYQKLEQCAYERYIIPIHYDDNAQLWENIPQKGPIWVFWWQGLDACDIPLVNACISSVQRHAAGRDVIIVSKYNYKNYITIDDIIIEKFNRGGIPVTQLSDIIRMALLSQRGGIWLDATVYLTQDIPESLSEYPFYSSQSYRAVPEAHWTIYFMGCGKGNPLCSLVYQAFINMYKDLDDNPEYFMLDVFLMAAYRHYANVRKYLDAVPVNNPERFALGDQLNKPLSSLVLPQEEYINKLTYKRAFKMSADNEPTVYNALLKGEL